ncbi:MAG: hypothetical protein ABEJ06_01865 [Haloarculaceae archaeon]
MTQQRPPVRLTRRRLLAGLGAGGVLLGTGRAGDGRRVPYSHYTYAATDTPDVDIRLGWYETYNGDPVERYPDGLVLENETSASWNTSAQSGAFANDHTASVFTFDDVLPGDHGTVVVGLFSERDPAAVWLQFANVAFAENGQTEPEALVDDTLDEGELGDAIQVELWYDVGVAGFGTCNGRRDPTEPLLASGSLREVTDGLSEGVPIATSTAETPRDCLDGTRPLCLGLKWWVDVDEGNTLQTDSAAFDVNFAAVACDDGTNPFAGGAE